MKNILVLFILSSLLSCKSPNHKTIYNPEFNHKDVETFSNIYEPEFKETIYDRVDFLKPGEKAKKEYRSLRPFFSKKRTPDFDMSKGYNYKDFWMKPDLEKIKNPAAEMQITFIGHAAFLFQFGKKVENFSINLNDDKVIVASFGSKTFSFSSFDRDNQRIILSQDGENHSISFTYEKFHHNHYQNIVFNMKDISIEFDGEACPGSLIYYSMFLYGILSL